MPGPSPSEVRRSPPAGQPEAQPTSKSRLSSPTLVGPASVPMAAALAGGPPLAGAPGPAAGAGRGRPGGRRGRGTGPKPAWSESPGPAAPTQVKVTQ